MLVVLSKGRILKNAKVDHLPCFIGRDSPVTAISQL